MKKIRHTLTATLILLALTSTAQERAIVAVKTNLLFDAASLINVELEVPLSPRYSVAAEMVCPWWRWGDGLLTSQRNCAQLAYGNLEIKYWLNDPELRPALSGWYISGYTGGGLYDFEHKAEGYQGEFIVAGGIAAGYAHPIGRSGALRMEYSLGVGYLQSKYRHYISTASSGVQWESVETDTGRFKYLGLTRAKVSIVWVLTRKNFRGGVR